MNKLKNKILKMKILKIIYIEINNKGIFNKNNPQFIIKIFKLIIRVHLNNIKLFKINKIIFY